MCSQPSAFRLAVGIKHHILLGTQDRLDVLVLKEKRKSGETKVK